MAVVVVDGGEEGDDRGEGDLEEEERDENTMQARYVKYYCVHTWFFSWISSKALDWWKKLSPPVPLESSCYRHPPQKKGCLREWWWWLMLSLSLLLLLLPLPLPLA